MVLGWMSTRVLGQYDLLVIEEEDPERPGPRVLRGPQRPGPREAVRLPARASSGCGWPCTRSPTGRSSPACRGCGSTSSAWSTTLLGAGRPRPQAPLRRRRPHRRRRARSGRTRSPTVAWWRCSPAPSSARSLDQVGGLMSLLEGHGDVTMDRAGGGLVPSAEPLRPGAARAPAQAAKPAGQAAAAAHRARGQAQPVRPGRAVHRRRSRTTAAPTLLDAGLGGARATCPPWSRSATPTAGSRRMGAARHRRGVSAEPDRRARSSTTRSSPTARTVPFPAPGTAGELRACRAAPTRSALLVLAVGRAGCEVTAVHVDHGLRPGRPPRPTWSRPPPTRCGAAFRAERGRRSRRARTSRPGPVRARSRCSPPDAAARPHRRRPGRDGAAATCCGAPASTGSPASAPDHGTRSSTCGGPRRRPCARARGSTRSTTPPTTTRRSSATGCATRCCPCWPTSPGVTSCPCSPPGRPRRRRRRPPPSRRPTALDADRCRRPGRGARRRSRPGRGAAMVRADARSSATRPTRPRVERVLAVARGEATATEVGRRPPGRAVARRGSGWCRRPGPTACGNFANRARYERPSPPQPRHRPGPR